MGVLDKFLDVMRLTEEEADDFYDDDYYEDDEPQVTKKSRRVKSESGEPRSKEKSKSGSKITPMRPVKKQGANGMEICMIRPKNIDDAREITETLLSNCTVILNLEGLDMNVAQRIIDFTSGSCFAISGNLQPEGSIVFHAGTSIDADGQLVTAGGRVMAVTSLADTIEAAREKSYKALENIHFDGMYRRGDIGCDILKMMK